jgi:hypothetical protein
MNIVQLQDQLKNFSQDQLVKEMQMPSGNAPPYLVLSEIMRRKQMETAFAGQQAPQETVAQEAVAAAGVPQGGIADMARALAPQTDMTQNTGVQAMAKGGPVKKMAEGDIVVRDGMQYVEQADGSYLREDGVALADDRTFGQRFIGDPMRSFFQPVGEAARETLQPTGDTLRGTMQPLGQDLRSLFEPRPIESRPIEPVAEAPKVSMPPALTYEEIIALARSGATPSLEQLQSSVEAGLLNDQQAADVQAMTEGTGYVPSAQEVQVAGLPGLTPTVPDRPRLNTPYQYAKQGIGDFAAGVFGGRTIGEQAAIDAERAAATAEEEEADRVENLKAAYTQMAGTMGQAGITSLAGNKPSAAAPKTDAPAAEPAQPSGGGGGGAGGGAGRTSSYEQMLMDTLASREKAATQDKWLALAQVGLNMMSSRSPTLLGAIGESGLKGVEAARAARDQYDKDKLDILGAIEQSRLARAAAAARAASGGITAYQAAQLARNDRKDLFDELSTIQTAISTMAPTGVPLNPEDMGEVEQLKAYAKQLTNQLFGASAADTNTDGTYNVQNN